MALNGLSQINIELTSRCNKSCRFCGHQNPKINKGLEYGDMDFALLERIVNQAPHGIITQLHRDGESTMYPRLADGLRLLEGRIRSIVTNGKLLIERAGEIIGNCETVSVSVFSRDPDGPEQFRIVREFLAIKGERKPNVNIKIVGDMDGEEVASWKSLGMPMLHRVLHSAGGDWNYRRNNPVIPEVGVCLDFLSHPSIDWRGNLFICNRISPSNEGRLGNLAESTLAELWNSPERMEMMKHHIAARRDLASPLCAKCEYYGVPVG